jgi:rubrerythrin
MGRFGGFQMEQAPVSQVGSSIPWQGTRAGLGRRISVGLGAICAGGAGAAALAAARGSTALPARDRRIIRFALELERLQGAFYGHALRTGKLTGEVRQFAEIVGHEEQAHRHYLEKLLGSTAGPSQQYRFGDAAASNRSFLAAAVKLEDTGLAGYNGQAANLSPSTLRSVARVVSVEARHAAWARDLAGQQPAPHATDTPISAAEAMSAIRPFLA